MIDKIPVAVWMSPASVQALKDYPEEKPGYALVQFGTDMASEGWVKLGDSWVDVMRPEYKELVAPVLAALEAEELKLKQRFADDLRKLRERKESFLALENAA